MMIKNYYFAFILCVLSGWTMGQGATASLTSQLSGNQITTNSTVKLNSPYNYSPRNYRKTVDAVVSLEYGREAHTDLIGQNWSLTVDYELKYLLPYSNGVYNTKSGSVSISYDAISGNSVLEDYDIFDTPYNAELTITNVTTGLSEIPEDVHLILHAESYLVPFLGRSSFGPTKIGYNTTTQEVYWDYLEGASEYELQWVFIDDHDIIPNKGVSTFTSYNSEYLARGENLYNPDNAKRLITEIIDFFQTKAHNYSVKENNSELLSLWKIRLGKLNIRFTDNDSEIIQNDQIEDIVGYKVEMVGPPQAGFLGYLEEIQIKTTGGLSSRLISRTYKDISTEGFSNVKAVSTGEIEFEQNNGTRIKTTSNISMDGYAPLSIPFDIKEPINIITSNQHFQFVPNHPEGVVYFRVRGIVELKGGRIQTQWSYSNGDIPTLLVIDNTNAFEQKKNWQVVTAYAEDGKFKKVASFVDGSSRGRQVQTNLSTENSTAVAENKYDYEGRAVASILPVPLGKNHLSYVDNFNVFEGIGSQKALIGNALSESSGAAKYYSSNYQASNSENPIVGLGDQYIPDAEGYPYSTIEFARDATGRVEATSGLGITHRIHDLPTDQHFNRFLNGTPAASELHRLFGSNVGKVEHYKKQVLIDPNGQAAVSYLDFAGRTVATALMGDAPANVNVIPSNTGGETITKRLKTGILDPLTQEISASDLIVNVEPQSYTFSYDLHGVYNTLGGLCKQCEYEVEISITDPDGYEMPGFPKKQTLPASTDQNCTAGTYAATFDFGSEATVIFSKIGTYSVTKTLRLSEGALQTIQEEASTMIGAPNYQDIRNMLVSITDFAQCEEDCDECGFDDLHQVGEEYCNATADVMRAQLEPEGYYFKNDRSVFNGETIVLVDGSSHTINSSDANDPFFDSNNWQDIWLNDFVPYLSASVDKEEYDEVSIHPEYHWYEACILEANYHQRPQSAKEYEILFMAAEKWSVALALGFLDPLNMVSSHPGIGIPTSPTANVDPFFTSYSNALNESSLNVMKGWMDEYPYNPFGTVLSIWEMAERPEYYQGTPTNDEKWRVFQMLYGRLKDRMRSAIAANLSNCDWNGSETCAYLNEEHAVVKKNELPTSEQGISDLQHEIIQEECDEVCPSNAELWVAQLSERCEEWSDLNLSEQGVIKAHFENYCRQHCGYENPYNVILAEDVTADPDLVAINTILSQDSDGDQVICSLNEVLEDIVVPNLYVEQCVQVGAVRTTSGLRELLRDMIAYLHANSSVIQEVRNYRLVSGMTEPDPLFERWARIADYNGWYIDDGVGVKPFSQAIEYMEFTYGASIGLYTINGFLPFLEPIHHVAKADIGPDAYFVLDGNDLSYIHDLQIGGAGSLPIVDVNGFYRSSTTTTTQCFSVINEDCGCMPDLFAELNNQPNEPSTVWTITEDQSERLNGIKELINCTLASLLIEYDGTSTVSSKDLMIDIESESEKLDWKQGGVGVSTPDFIDEIIIKPTSNGGLILFHVKGSDPLAQTGLFVTGSPDILDAENFDRILEIRQANFSGGFTQTFIKRKDQTIQEVGTRINGVDAQGIGVTSCKNQGYTHVNNINGTITVSGSSQGLSISFFDVNGINIPATDIIEYGEIFRKVSSDITNTSNTQGLIYAQYATEIVYDDGVNGQQSITAYIYSNDLDLSEPFYHDCFAGIEVEEPEGSCFDCISDLQVQIDIETERIYGELLNQFIVDRITEHRNTCFDSGFEENFKVSYTNKEYHYTLYYYDQAGNLVRTVPPEGVKPLSLNPADGHFTADDEFISSGGDPQHTLVTDYNYNTFNALVWKNTPDGGSNWYWYDDLGRIRFSQDDEQYDELAQDGVDDYNYIKYDALGRPVESGRVANDTWVTLRQEGVDGSLAASSTARRFINDATNFPIWGENTLSEITSNYYDEPFVGGDLEAQYAKNRVTAIVYREEEGTTTDNRYEYDYDIHGLVKSVVHRHPELGAKRTDYTYELISGNVEEVAYQKGKEDQFFHRYRYDADNRLIEASTSQDGRIWEREAHYYYYSHGTLARTEIGEDLVQGQDHYHTIQGWIKGCNLTVAPDRTNGYKEGLHDIGKDGIRQINSVNRWVAQDEFAFALGYFEGDYAPIGSSTPGFNTIKNFGNNIGLYQGVTGDGAAFDIKGSGMYNGNIVSMATNLPSADLNPNATNAEQGQAKWLYQHDQLNRVTHANYFNPKGSLASVTNTQKHDFNARYTYDGNGNLETLQRYGNGQLIDDLTYHYALQGVSNVNKTNNQLVWVDDAITDASLSDRDLEDQEFANVPHGFPGGPFSPIQGNYHYDKKGNLTYDHGDETMEIEWNQKNKIVKVIRYGQKPNLYYRYDVLGNRISKTIRSKDANGDELPELDWETTNYAYDANGSVMAIYSYKKNAAQTARVYYLDEQPIYGSSRLGMYKVSKELTGIVLETTSGQREVGGRFYELSNHLGNVYTVVTDARFGIDKTANNIGDYYQTQVVALKEYYPFGMELDGHNWNDDKYRYGFNGKEQDLGEEAMGGGGGSTYDYGFRIYNPALAKFLSVDPLSPAYPWYTPYQFAGNKPVVAIDLDGLEEWVVIRNIDQNSNVTELKLNTYSSVLGSTLAQEFWGKYQNGLPLEEGNWGSGGADYTGSSIRPLKGILTLEYDANFEGTLTATFEKNKTYDYVIVSATEFFEVSGEVSVGGQIGVIIDEVIAAHANVLSLKIIEGKVNNIDGGEGYVVGEDGYKTKSNVALALGSFGAEVEWEAHRIDGEIKETEGKVKLSALEATVEFLMKNPDSEGVYGKKVVFVGVDGVFGAAVIVGSEVKVRIGVQQTKEHLKIELPEDENVWDTPPVYVQPAQTTDTHYNTARPQYE